MELQKQVGILTPATVRQLLTDATLRPADLRDKDWFQKLKAGAHPDAEYFLEAIKRYAESDFREAWKLITENADVKPPDEVRMAAYCGRGRAEGLAAIPKLLKEFESETSDERNDSWGKLIAAGQGWAEKVPEAALEWAWKSTGMEKPYVFEGVLRGLPQASDWRAIWEKADRMGTVKLSIGGTWSAKDVCFVEVLAGRWVESDPNAAIQWMTAFTKDTGHELFPDAIAAWMRSDPSKCISWLHEAETAGRIEKGELGRRIYYSSFTHPSRILPVLLEGHRTESRKFALEALVERHQIDQEYLGVLKKTIEKSEQGSPKK